MPQVINPNDPQASAQEVSKEQFQKLLDTSDNPVFSPHEEGPGRVRLWDNVQQGWTAALPKQLVHGFYLEKLVEKCSVCTFTSAFTDKVRTHVKQVEESAQDHEQATPQDAILAAGVSGIRCSGCGASFGTFTAANRHIEQRRRMGREHSFVEALTMRLYTLTSSEPDVLHRTHIRGEDGTPEEPDASQVDRSTRRRHRRRGRGQKRSAAV
jgi:hypothetical protein